MRDAADAMLSPPKVPYVWGGQHAPVDRRGCEECRACAAGHGKTRGALRSRIASCPACAVCGVDCAGFVTAFFRQLGLRATFADVWRLGHTPAGELTARFHLREVEGGARDLAPGDLLVYQDHVAVVLTPYQDGTADVIHSTALTGDGVGGVTEGRGVPVASFRGPLVRVLRHEALGD